MPFSDKPTENLENAWEGTPSWAEFGSGAATNATTNLGNEIMAGEDTSKAAASAADTIKEKAAGMADSVKNAASNLHNKLPDGVKDQIGKAGNLIGNNFATSFGDIKENFTGQDATKLKSGLRIAGGVIGLGVAFKLGKSALKGTKINAETLEPEPMTFVQRTSRGLGAVVALAGGAAAVAYSGGRGA